MLKEETNLEHWAWASLTSFRNDLLPRPIEGLTRFLFPHPYALPVVRKGFRLVMLKERMAS